MTDIPKPVEMLERIMQAAKTVMPESIGNDLKDNLRAVIQDIISELDVVTREEFEIQKKVLKRTRSKVDELEKLLESLSKE